MALKVIPLLLVLALAILSLCPPSALAGIFNDITCPFGAAAAAEKCAADVTRGHSSDEPISCCEYQRFRDCLGSNTENYCGKSVSQLLDMVLESTRHASGDHNCDNFEFAYIRCLVYFHKDLVMGLGAVLGVFVGMLVAYCCLKGLFSCFRAMCCPRKKPQYIFINPRSMSRQPLVAAEGGSF